MLNKDFSLQYKVNEIKKSPIFAMSLASKELFHSNFWAWLFEHDISYAKIFFNDLSHIDDNGVKREENNMDITIHSDGKLYVIENKLKSLPREDQLNDYKNKNDNFICGVVTGLKKPSFGCEGWRFMSYDEISKRISKIAETEPDSFYKSLIEQYSKMINDLSDIATSIIDTVGDRLIRYEDIEEVAKIRFDDVLKKLNADRFVSYLEKYTSFGEKIEGYDRWIWSDFTNKSAIVDVRYEKKNGNSIGIQIQGNQYRRFVQIKNANVDSEKLYKKYVDKGWLWDRSQISDTIDGHHTSMNKNNRYDKYSKPGIYYFLYQYYNVSEESGFDELTEQIKNDIELATKILKEDGKIDC